MNLANLVYESKQIRVVGTSDNPWWVAKDVCEILDQPNISQVVSRLDDDEKGIQFVDTPGGQQEMLCVNESGLYALVLTSRKLEAKKFKKWITSEVLPSIRKTGKYEISAKEEDEADALVRTTESLLAMAIQMRDAKRQLKEHSEQLSALLANQFEAEAELKALPEATTTVAPKTSRAKVNELVRNYVVRTNANYQEVWRKLYKEVSYRCHYNAVQRAKNRGVKAMDVIEQDGKIEDLFAIACELLK